jgi:Ion transport protein
MLACLILWRSVFGIPIGVLGAGFEAIVSAENRDNTAELYRDRDTAHTTLPAGIGSSIERAAYHFVNGLGSIWAARFELMIYGLILLSVAVGAWQTVPGQENAFHEIEWIAVIVFTIEYVIRLVGTGADPEFRGMGGGFVARLRFIPSFYSVIDLLAIVPFYVALALPESVVNDYDEYLRMLRILRLVKLDKYIPSITLIGTYGHARVVCWLLLHSHKT